MASQQDPRFSSLGHDPRFMRPKKAATKLKIDARFSSMLRGKAAGDFGTGSSAAVDKYGRKAKSSTASDLKKFYHLEEDEEEESGESGDEEEVRARGSEAASGSGSEDDASSAAASEGISGYALARGGGDVESSEEEGRDEQAEASSGSDSEGSEAEGASGSAGDALSINPLAQVGGRGWALREGPACPWGGGGMA